MFHGWQRRARTGSESQLHTSGSGTMEDFSLVRCDSLDAGSACDREAMTTIDHLTLDLRGSDPTANLEPSPAELAQCEAEVGTLLSIIAELNKKMGSLKAPSEPGDQRSPGPSRPLVPDLLSHRLARSTPERSMISAVTSKPPLAGRGGGGVVWTKLQEVLSSVEDSISCKRSWAAPITASDRDKHQEHLRAAQESWTKATQLLEDMEKEFGISCPSGLTKDQHQEELLDLEKQDSAAVKSSSQSHQEELESISQMEEEKNKLVGLSKAWRSGSHSPSYRPSSGPLSPDWASPPYPGSPLLQRRSGRATPLSVGGDASPLGSVNSCSPCPSPIGLESETERLSRYIERLKARNERLTAALERSKAESEHIGATLKRTEADCCALQTALRYCEECEEAYGELLSLYDAERQRGIPPQPDSAEAVGDRQEPEGSSAQCRKMETEELSTSFSTAGVTEEIQEMQSHTGQRTPELSERETVLRQKIQHLKRDRAAISLTKASPGPEGKVSPKTGHQAASRGGHMAKDKPPDTKKEKASVFYELISVREEMSDLRALIRLKEKELRCLEWSMMAQKAQEAAGAYVPESLREELEDCKVEQQRLCENAAKLGSDGDIARTRPILKELQAVLQREQALKKRLALVQDSLNTALSDTSSPRRDNGEQIARLTQAHSKALSSYRQIRRKYREQVWRLEQKVAAMMESRQHQNGEQKAAAVETSEWRREETVL